MKVLITGNRGKIGTHVYKTLAGYGMEVIGCDLKDGKDIRNIHELEKSFTSYDVIIHMAIYSGNDDNQSELMKVNLQGTWNILTLAARYNVKKILYISSVDAIGIFKGQGKPLYLPVDNKHPCFPSTPYGISKKLSEDMCRYWGNAHSIPVVCLRPPGVWFEDTYRDISAARKKNPEFEWKPYWEYGAFIDIRDLTQLILNILMKKNIKGFQCYLVSSKDITTSGLTSIELSRKIHPDVPWVGDKTYKKTPYKTLLDIEPVKKAFGWNPIHTWQKFLKNN